MELVFDIAGTPCTADRVSMRGNTIEADFPSDAQAPLADAFDGGQSIAIAGMPAAVTYTVQTYRSADEGGFTAVFSVNSSKGRVLH